MADQRKHWPYTLPNSVAWQNFCTSSKTAVFNIEAFRHFIMSQQGKQNTKFSGLLYITKNWKFFAYFMHILNSCVALARLPIWLFWSLILKFWLLWTSLAFFGNKKAGNVWLFLAYFQSDRLGSGKTLSELHSLQISCDEGLLPCRVHRILQKFYCCLKNDQCYW